MIPLEKQVTSLELSKELKKLGVKQDSLWYWVLLDGYFDYQLVQKGYDPHLRTTTKDFCSAFTVAELGEGLPKKIKKENRDYYLRIIPREYDNDWLIKYARGDSVILNYTFDNTEANARAKMRIYLTKNKFMGANE